MAQACTRWPSLMFLTVLLIVHVTFSDPVLAVSPPPKVHAPPPRKYPPPRNFESRSPLKEPPPLHKVPLPPPSKAIDSPPPKPKPPPPSPSKAIAAPPPAGRTPPSISCYSIADVISRTPQLSVLAAILKKVPSLLKQLQDKKAAWTVLAPSNKVLQYPTQSFNAATWASYIQLHVIKESYQNENEWLSARSRVLTTLNGRKLRFELQIGDDFEHGISYLYVFVGPGKPGDKPPKSFLRLTFQSNKPSPVLPTCKGAVYVVDGDFSAN